MSDPTLSDIDFKNKMARVWTTLNFSNTFWYFSKILCSNLECDSMIVNLSDKDMISMMSFYIWCEKILIENPDICYEINFNNAISHRVTF